MERRQFLALSLGVLGCRPKPDEATPPATPALPTEATFYGDTFDAFAAALYGELRKTPGNVFLSPYSISTALAMTAEGAKGETLSQMQSVLGLPVTESVNAALAAKAKPTKIGTSYELATANALWAQAGYGWSPEYMKRVMDTFRASVRDVDFKSDPEAVRLAINQWVELQTRDKIKSLLAKGILTPLTRLVLVNAIYFKGDWATAFLKDQTQLAPFTLLDGTKVQVPLMRQTGTAGYFENQTVQAIRLLYKGGEISFVAVLPKDPAKFAELDANVASNKLGSWNKGFENASVDYSIPRFKIETEFNLNDPLEKLGMKDAFHKLKADFNGMLSKPQDEVLSISDVIHKAFVDVNEEGTVAAAATAVHVAITLSERPIPKTFRADRPFLFALRHEPSGTLLFLGRCVKPA